MDNVKRSTVSKSSCYSSKELLDLLSLYEGELQARDALLNMYQQQSISTSALQLSSSAALPSTQCSSVAQLPSTSSACRNALLRDAQLMDSEHAGGECPMCANALLQCFKITQKQQIWERKIAKMFFLLKKRYSEGQHELEERQRRMEQMAGENWQYAKNLETERDRMLEELTKCKTELAELFEQRVNIQEELEGEKERTRLMVLHLMDERKRMVDEVRKHQQKQREEKEAKMRQQMVVALNNTPAHRPVSNSLSTGSGGQSTDIRLQQMGLLRDENARLRSTVNSLQAEKAALKKRLDQFLGVVHQDVSTTPTSEQQHHFNSLQQLKMSPTRKDPLKHPQQQKMANLRDNGFIMGGSTLPQKQRQQQHHPFFPPLAQPPPTPPVFHSSSLSSPTTATLSPSYHSFSTIPPRPPPTIRPSTSLPLHLGSSSSSSSSALSAPHPSVATAVSDVGNKKQRRPTTVPEDGGSIGRTSSRTTRGDPPNQQHTHQFPVTDSDWMRMAPMSRRGTDHRAIAPLMGTYSANFLRSSAARPPPPPPPVPRTSVATIPRSPQHRCTTVGVINEQQQRIGTGQHDPQLQQSRVAIARRSSSLPRRMMSGVPTTAAVSAQQSVLPPQFRSPNTVQPNPHPQQQQARNHHILQQHSRAAIPAVASEQFVYQQSTNGLVGGDTNSHFL